MSDNLPGAEEEEGIEPVEAVEEEDGDFFMGEEEDGEEEDEIQELPPDHPLFATLQDKMKDQLQRQYDVIEEEIRDKQALKNQLSENREQVGVELYTIQQTLVKLQARLTEANEKRQQYEQERLEKEAELKEARQTLADREAELKERTTEYENQRKELDRLNENVLLLEQHNQEILNNVAVTRRETYKSEQAASETEIAKKEQDMYIDRLTQQVQNIGSGLAEIEAQVLAQRAETKTARDALLQASLEMEKITFERNHLIQEWNSSLVNVKRRAETLASIEAASAKQEEEIRALQNEYNGIKKQIADQEEIAERNTGLYSKIRNRIQYLDQKIKETEQARGKLQDTLDQLTTLTREKEKLLSKLQIEKNQANSEYKNSAKGTNEISNQIHELEDKIIAHVTEQTNMKRDTIAAQNEVQKVRDQIEEKDRELSQLQNEAMKLKIDRLNITGQCAKFERGLQEIVEELKQKDALINQYELQIRKNNVNIEKLQSEVDKLNRKYEELTSAQNGEEYGPLERKIRVLESKIQQSDETAQENQAQWLKKQTELVALTHQCEDSEESCNTLHAHIAVLSRKRDRTRKALEATEKEIENLNIQIRLLQREMSRLGEKLSSGAGQGDILIEGNINFEADILEQLRKKEEESASLETKIEELHNFRSQCADDLMETEKDIMLWEKKLQLAREMREALDPNYGASELKTMKKEVTRMELRLKQIKKQQQTIVQEMEFALRRRETIATRGAVKQRLNQDKTHSDVTKGITELRRQIKALQQEHAAIESEIKEHDDAQQEQSAEIEQLDLISRELQVQKQSIEQQLKEEEKQKIVAHAKLERLQQKQRMFKTPDQRLVVKKPENYESQIQTLKAQQDQLNDIINMLITDHPHLESNLVAIKEKYGFE